MRVMGGSLRWCVRGCGAGRPRGRGEVERRASGVDLARPGGGGDAGLDDDAVAARRSSARRCADSRTAPKVRGTAQPKQMPIRQFEGMRAPASSGAVEEGRSPRRRARGPGARATRARPRRSPPRRAGTARRAAPPPVPRCPNAIRRRRGARPARTPTPGGRASRARGRRVRRGGGARRVSVCRSMSRTRPAAASARSSGPKTTSTRRGALCTSTTSARSGRLRRIPMTGVIPLPAVTKSADGGGPSGTTKSPVAWSSMTSRPAAQRRRGGRSPSPAMRLTVTASRSGGWAGCHRVGAPVAHPVDIDAEPHVLPRRVRPPAAAGSDEQGRRVGGLGAAADDPPLEVGAESESGATSPR